MPNEVVSGAIYGLHGPDGIIRYIGFTVRDPRIRLSQHLWEARNGSTTYKNNWIRSIGTDNVQMRIIEYYSDIPFEDLKRREITCIAAARTLGQPLTNSTDGGDGNLGWVAGPESRQKMSKSHTGKKHSDETRLSMSKAVQRRLKSPDYVPKIHSLESRLRMSEARKGEKNHNFGKPVPAETKRKMSEAAKRNPTKNFADTNHKRWHVARGLTSPACQFCFST